MTSQDGNNFILVITDICTRFTLLRSIPNKSALIVARRLYEVFADFGIPRIVQSDNGTEFVNSVLKELKESCGFAHRFISSYHPQANGVAESHVKLAKQLLTKHVQGDWSEWCHFIPMVQLSLNNRVTARHGSTPFSLMFARRMNDPVDYRDSSSQPLTEEQMIERNAKLASILYPAIEEVNRSHSAKMANDFQISHRILEDGFPIGAMVMKKVDTIAAKSNAKFEGPFKVLEKTKYGTYVLLDRTNALYQKRVPADHLKLISVPEEYLKDDDHYEVEAIVAHRGTSRNREYLVKWKHYPDSSNSWVAAKDFDATDLIESYWKSSQRKLIK